MLEELSVIKDDGVAIITLNRPETLNAVNRPLQRLLERAFEEAALSDDVGCVVVTGAGRGFCSGGDRSAIGDRESRHRTETRTNLLERHIDNLRETKAALRLHEMGKPTIAMINGACAGWGMSMAGACDFRFAATSAVFTTAYIKLGLAGDGGGGWFWSQILGTAKARRLYMLSERFDGPTALSFGLVHELWPDDELRSRTMEIAKALANGPRAALRYTKELLNAAEEGTFGQVMKLESITHALSSRARTETVK